MSDRDLDDILNRAAGPSGNVDPALLQGIANRIGADLRPVRPMPSSPMLAAGLIAACVAVACAGGAILGLHGIAALGAARIGTIFPALLALICLAAAASVAEMIREAGVSLPPAVMLAGSCLVLVAIFALSFSGSGGEHFVAQGIACLKAGLLLAIPTAGIAYWILRRGFAVSSPAAGVAIWSLAGLAGVSMLELHCPNFEAAHVIVWHTAVLLLGGAGGGGLALLWRSWRRKRM